jgi:hypothetical protein
MLDMKLLTATAYGQGMRDNDFDWTVEGELVWLGFVCDDDLNDPDGGCGCGRGFSGLSSMKATTTALVRDLPMSRGDVVEALAGYLELGGYDGVLAPSELQQEVDDLLIAGAHWETGSIVERRLSQLRSRGRLASAEPASRS